MRFLFSGGCVKNDRKDSSGTAVSPLILLRTAAKARKRMQETQNVLGGALRGCGKDPMTGFYRSGDCRTGPDDLGVHVVCAQMTQSFLDYSKARGNDLITPQPQWGFPGLKPGDRWCLCASRWQEALDAGVAPPVILEATHAAALEIVSLADLQAHAIDAKWPKNGHSV